MTHKRAPGDIVTMTGLVRDIALTYPGQFAISVGTYYAPIWENNPYIVAHHPVSRIPRGTATLVPLCYKKGVTDSAHRRIHFLAHWHEAFNRHFKTGVQLRFPYPDLHLSPHEQANPLVQGRYWVVVSGGKSDAPVKVWSGPRMQRVVDALRERGVTLVQIGSTGKGHWHHKLARVVNLVGKTDLRQMIRVIAGAEGVICGITAAMHMAAAFQKPCVTIAGGRESWWWEAYVNENPGFGPLASGKLAVPHKYLHTIGQLDCCAVRGCWKNVVQHTTDSRKLGRSMCKQPVRQPGSLAIPACMALLQPETIVEAVMAYFTDRIVPPPATPAPPPPAATPMLHPQHVWLTPLKHTQTQILDLFDDEQFAQAEVDLPAPPVPPEPAVELAPVLRAKDDVEPARAPGLFLDDVRAAPIKPPAQRAAVVAAPRSNDSPLFDHPLIGGKFTVCVLLYGPDAYAEMQRDCLAAILDSIPKHRRDLRVGSNALNARSLALVNDLEAAGDVTKHYRNETNRFKYPVMRDMFHDADHPIDTKWLMWFDDDSLANRRPDWLATLSQEIINHHDPRKPASPHMFGAAFFHQPRPSQVRWYSGRPWFKGRPWQDQYGRPTSATGPKDRCIHFVAGGWWAASTAAMRACDIPDAELGNNGGDITIGAQLHQGGYGFRSFNHGKQYIFTSSRPRRGVTTAFPGLGDPRQPLRTADP